MQFKDYFSAQADEYARRRPNYPPDLFEYLASLTAVRDLAWDCGTGNGQAAVGIAPYFERVIATDPSPDQLRNAFQHPGVTYTQATAEESGLQSASVDLVTVAQAVHWFDLDRFYTEVKRVLKPGGVCAIWCYILCRISPELDIIIDRFYFETVGPYWPRERAIVDDGYASLHFPFDAIEAPDFAIELEWELEDLIGYLGTWSPVRRYIEANGHDPIAIIADSLRSAWGNPTERRRVVWPVKMRVGRSS
ncbi:MAG: class I SAM-dependent methyltransferase [Chloroflexota bacterium]